MTRLYDPDGALIKVPPYNGDSTSDCPDVGVYRRMPQAMCGLPPFNRKAIMAIRAGAHEDGLQATQLVDVAERLQAYGRLGEIAETDDGIIVGTADHIARQKETVVIWTGYAIGYWHPSDIWTRGLGGSETAAWRLSEELANMGYRVTLYGHFDRDDTFGDVILRDFRKYDPSKHVGVFISFRNARVFDNFRPNADHTYVWLEDLAGPHSEGLSPTNAGRIDRVVTVSHWHKNHMLEVYDWLQPSQVFPCRNGIDLSFFERTDLVREKRVIYSSSPDRGLATLLELWPEVRERVPDAELVSTYSRWYDIVADNNPIMQKNRERIYELLDQPGVKRLQGGLGQKALAELMLSSLVWVHPSWYTVHDMEMLETSCISAMEAQAAGCVVVASNWGALSETVQVGTRVDGNPHSLEWRKTFVDCIVAGLTDETVQRASQIAGPDAMRDMHWRGAAEQLAGLWVTV